MNKNKRKPVKTNLRQERFPYEFIIDLNGQKAAERCGISPKGAKVWASRQLTKANVQAKIKELQEATQQRALMDAEAVERKLDSLISVNLRDFVHEDGSPKAIHELTREQASCVKELETHKTPIGTVCNLKFFDKVQSIRTKMQRLGMLKDVREVVTESYADRIKKLENEANQEK